DLGDGRGQRRLAMIDVSDRADVHVRLGTLELCLRHFDPLPLLAGDSPATPVFALSRQRTRTAAAIVLCSTLPVPSRGQTLSSATAPLAVISSEIACGTGS